MRGKIMEPYFKELRLNRKIQVELDSISSGKVIATAIISTGDVKRLMFKRIKNLTVFFDQKKTKVKAIAGFLNEENRGALGLYLDDIGWTNLNGKVLPFSIHQLFFNHYISQIEQGLSVLIEVNRVCTRLAEIKRQGV